MRKYLLVAAMGLAACGSDKKGGTTTVNNGNNTVGGDTSVTDPNDATEPGPVADPTDPNTLTGPQIAQMGRFNITANGNQMAWAGSRITAGVKGTKAVTVGLQTTNPSNLGKVVFSVNIDGVAANPPTITLVNDQSTKSFVVTLPNTNYHYIQVTKISEPSYGLAMFTGIKPGDGGTLMGTPPPSERHIEFIGDSITLGYGVTGTYPCTGKASDFSNSDLAFSALTAKELKADYTLIAVSGRGLATNLDGSTTATQTTGDVNNANNVMPAMFLNTIPPSTSTPTPIAWDPALVPASVVVVNLGTNDFSYVKNAFAATHGNSTDACTAALCNPDPDAFKAAYKAFLQKIRDAYPLAHIVATTGPMLSDASPATVTNTKQYTTAKTYISDAVSAFADTNTTFYDFGVQDTGSVACDFHPNAATHETMALGGTDALGVAKTGLAAHIKSSVGWQ